MVGFNCIAHMQTRVNGLIRRGKKSLMKSLQKCRMSAPIIMTRLIKAIQSVSYTFRNLIGKSRLLRGPTRKNWRKVWAIIKERAIPGKTNKFYYQAIVTRSFGNLEN